MRGPLARRLRSVDSECDDDCGFLGRAVGPSGDTRYEYDAVGNTFRKGSLVFHANLAGAVAPADELAAFALDLEPTGIDRGITLRGAAGVRVHANVALRGRRLDLDIEPSLHAQADACGR